jgi:hypothetical protein
MAERKSLTKKIRFEVFKRDSFSCQYCGSKAPDVILEVDHMKPVSKGGTNDIMNLVTSCFECNRGKSDRQISDNSVVEKQRKQIEELNIRRQQLEMMLEWRDGEVKLKAEEANKAIEYLNGYFKNLTLNKQGEGKVIELVKKFGVINVLNAIDTSYRKYYLDWKDEGENFEAVLSKIGGICFLTNQPPHIQKLSYIKGIAKNKFYLNQKDVTKLMIGLNKYYSNDYCLEHLESVVKNNEIKSFSGLINFLND